MFKRVGKAPSGERLEKIKKQSNYRDGKFHNVEPTSMNPDDVPFYVIMKAMISRPATVTPSEEIPHIKTDLSALSNDRTTFVWFGHSSYFINHNGFRILIDPVFSGNASPVKFFGKPFAGTDIYKAADIPEIDLLILTHDHYDHLDYPLIKQIHPKVKKVVTSLGVGEHLELWGVEKNKIVELGWREEHQIKNLTITAMPSRHFSGRSFTRFNTLWSSFVLQWPDQKIYVGGDSGYSAEFKKIGEEYGPFDLVFLECGQYSKYWPQIHMMPEETVLAAKDLNAKILVPVHWGKFVLSLHPWNEPIRRLLTAAKKEGQKFVAPRLGEAWDTRKEYTQKNWWNFEDKQ
ncbi:MBL fold metallo-hydrolase [Antarcticibacterium sp. 1MA-6-2]|uniref:MBL fold metallo-hydrolase n=1 Tax=Antarcticibacterium sp. 1MA-6-2 TaxID=2908210 RepID=UPI001F2E7384|nr:MBL fold metallo-hydrolase [Antarcticibacterium sp. 1MA-6-2]UJH92037.1 MBL fold metallo-hydrolase [Antarcticibacterium sp. 1MA-6-2]